MEAVEKHKRGYKKTKLGLIPESWSIKQLKDLGYVLSGLTYKPNDIDNNGVLVLRSSNVNERQIIFEDNVFVDVNEGGFNPVRKGDILICVRNGSKSLIGKNAKINEQAEGMAFGAFMGVYRSVHNDYLFHLFDTDYYYREIHRNLGATINSINGSNLKKFYFPLPEASEQKVIAKCLNTWDKAIQDISKLIGCKRLQKKGLMQQLLSGKKRLKGFNDEWTTWTYQELFKKVSRPVAWDDNEIYDLISVRRRSGGLFHRDSLKGEKILTKSLFTAKTGDFLMSKMQILHGASGLVTEEFNNMKISGSYIAVIPQNKGTLIMEYLNWYSQTPYFYHQTYRSSYGVHIEKMTFNFKLFKKEEIELPGIEEQQAIVDVLNAAQKEIDLLIQKRDQLKEQKKGLMQKLLTGKKRLNIK
ncbi:hypothetical protein C1T31_10145 [Hanstruepera neustonica]|uniref:Type I restriction modification DNA specificity domain-containing protein n=1 Tax=Hanstruepera neustonica TaxID=1445657 RepID=A0A2K1DXU3_9FLAO|nr:restriction endonuclease subunit S [Hanstruepera neustonica]PNQ72856.1 hypothetical protein C1T31_10145 [Hanstruepera neustonica]